MATSAADFIVRGYASFIYSVNKLEGLVLTTSVLLMALNNVANISGRILLNRSLFFVEELNSILIILITFTGTSYAARKAAHIRMTAIFDMLPPGGQKVLSIIVAFVTSSLMAVLGYFSVEYIVWIAPKGRVLPALGIPVYITYLWIPVSLWLTAVEYFLAGVKNLLYREIYISSEASGRS